MTKPSEGTASAVAINTGLDVRELHGADAVDSILSDFTDLELEPIPEDEHQAKLRRAGLTVEESARHALRAEVKGQR
jgi:hypothetical protein